MPLSPYVTALILLLLSSACINVVFTGNTLADERSHILSALAFLFFYLFYIYRISEQEIIRIFTVFALAVFFIQVFQTIFPETAVFGTDDTDTDLKDAGIASMRNGLYRFRLETYFFTLPCLYYYWNRLLSRLNLRDFLLFSIFLISTYLYLTRQIMAATAIALSCSYLFIKNSKAKIHIILLAGVFGFILLQFADDLFGKLLFETKTDLSGDNIRLLSAGFYWDKICENPLTFLFGNGHPELLHKWKEKGLYPSDIGFIGEMFHYGLLWIVFYFYSVYTILVKYGRQLPLYIKLFVFGTFTNSIMIFPYRSHSEYFIWATMLYIASLYITQTNIRHTVR